MDDGLFEEARKKKKKTRKQRREDKYSWQEQQPQGEFTHSAVDNGPLEEETPQSADSEPQEEESRQSGDNQPQEEEIRQAEPQEEEIRQSGDIGPQQEETTQVTQSEEMTQQETTNESEDFTADQLGRAQREDDSLKRIWEIAEQDTGSRFFTQNGILYRRWLPKRGTTRADKEEVEQIVLPRCYRRIVLKLAHSIPLSGHLGRRRTRDRISQRFYWPRWAQDVTEYCRSCEACQKTMSGRVREKARLISLPIIDIPFSRIAMDIVGPLVRSKSGHKYILVIVDYATRYPEAIPLRDIEAHHIADELIKLFSRVGIPQEILTDQELILCHNYFKNYTECWALRGYGLRLIIPKPTA